MRPWKFIALMAFVGACVSYAWAGEHKSPAQDSGVGDFSEKIFDGEPVPENELRAVVGLTYGNDRLPGCSGTLIAPDMVLTAAHCICSIPPSHVFVGNDPNGKGRRYYWAGSSRTGYYCDRGATYNGVDIAVLAINGRVGVVEPMDLSTPAGLVTDNEVLVAGFGATNREGTQNDYLKRRATIPVISPSCSSTDSARRYGCEIAQEMVAGRRTTPDTCTGDSGGPLMVKDYLNPGRYKVAAVTSRGIANTPNICGDGGIYERLDQDKIDWINAAMISLRGIAPFAEEDADTGTENPVPVPLPFGSS